MKKPRSIKADYNATDLKATKDFLTGTRQPYVMEISNYTCKIISESLIITFMRKAQSNKVFSAAAKITKDLQGKPIPDINPNRNFYYDTSFKGDVFYADSVQMVDIKSAYATIMRNEGLITEKTYQYVNSLPKADRLAAIGMIASRKDIFHITADGKTKQMPPRISELAPFFFYCVQKTDDIIQCIKNQILYDSFLFSWVDAVFFISPFDSHKKITQDYLKRDFNLDSTAQNLTNFEVILKPQHEHYLVKCTDEKGRQKPFIIPLPESYLKKQIIAYSLQKNKIQ